MPRNTPQTIFTITGDVAAASFPPWIKRHAKKLGVQQLEIEASPNVLTVRGFGAPEMVEALAIACSLGPAEVMVENVSNMPNFCEISA